MPVRFKPSTTTFIGRVRTDGSVSTRRGFDDAMVALVDLDESLRWVDESSGVLEEGDDEIAICT